jgi:hypothetical protein
MRSAMGMVVVDIFFLVMVGYCSKMVIKTSKVTSPFFFDIGDGRLLFRFFQ